MQLKTFVVTLFATVALAVPNALDGQPKIVGRPKGPIPGSGPSCCSYIPGQCQPSCCPGGCPK
ncbi:uncharacterized protein CTRU02_204068 [Colletotrichum truncatum]|uniref:Uncharacterized protein n=1 Tax=Colletotrichum truncatum TaxID=5467 RepID=A0ACC3ZAY1_COLTU|nr:uncharacterized protein CTRU02_13663 [Colletotrichum truncatum]KAF6783196.1 hypothetical protein CTRU02_13663 [Colletotrichum truncatum]